MSDIGTTVSKIIAVTSDLTTAIKNLKKTRNEESANTHGHFKLVLAKSQKCESLLHILETSVSEHFSGGLALQLAKIKTTT